MRDRARQARLIAPHLSRSLGCHGFTHRQMVDVFAKAGYSALDLLRSTSMRPTRHYALARQGCSETQRERFLAPLAHGEVRSAFLMTEPATEGGAGSDPSILSTRAVQDGDDCVISGRTTFATGFDGAAFAIVMAWTGEAVTMLVRAGSCRSNALSLENAISIGFMSGL